MRIRPSGLSPCSGPAVPVTSTACQPQYFLTIESSPSRAKHDRQSSTQPGLLASCPEQPLQAPVESALCFSAVARWTCSSGGRVAFLGPKVSSARNLRTIQQWYISAKQGHWYCYLLFIIHWRKIAHYKTQKKNTEPKRQMVSLSASEPQDMWCILLLWTSHTIPWLSCLLIFPNMSILGRSSFLLHLKILYP